MTDGRYQTLLPPDIRPEWLNVIRAVQASCSKNEGFGKVTIDVVVNGNLPVLWSKGEFTQISPKQLSSFEISPKILMALAQMMNVENDDQKNPSE